jgi:hypothetical protein
MTKSPYLARREARLAVEELKREIIFGFVISTILLVIGTWRYFLVVGASDLVSLGLAAAGALGILLTLILPSAWRRPESWLGTALRAIGGFLFTVLLTLVYGLLVTPVGWVLRTMKGSDPLYSWTSAPPEGMEGWRPKQVLYEANIGQRANLSVARRFIKVLQFFASQGHYLFIPTLLLLLVLGMILFFVKSSALAPFIYTLF